MEETFTCEICEDTGRTHITDEDNLVTGYYQPCPVCRDVDNDD